MKILDAGCGTGAVTKVLYDLAHQQGLQEISLHAFDLTPAMLDLFGAWVEKEGAKNIALQQANVLDLENQIPPHWKSFDLIVSSAMFEYIPKENLGQALRNLKRLLHENGRLLVFVTRRTWIASWTGALWWRTNLFDPDELEGELQQAGFKTVQFKKLPEGLGCFHDCRRSKTALVHKDPRDTQRFTAVPFAQPSHNDRGVTGSMRWSIETQPPRSMPGTARGAGEYPSKGRAG